MAVITISRETGSEGAKIARSLASHTGYHFVSWEQLGKVLRDFGLLDADEVYDAPASFFSRFLHRREEVTDMLNRAVRALARHGDVVILGRGGYAVLQDLADVVNVRIQAPLPIRARRVLERGEVPSGTQADAYVKERDERRAAFIEFSYRVRWDSTQLFDLVVDTGKISPELAVAIIAEASQAAMHPGPDARLAGALEVDPVVRDAISEMLGCKTIHAPSGEAAGQEDARPPLLM